MRRREEIFLDFTPLLDVTLILLFFFLLFASLQTAEARQDMERETAQAQQTQAELERQLEEYAYLTEKAEALVKGAQEEMDMIQASDPRKASNLKAMMAFNCSGNLKLILDMEDRTLRIFHGSELLCTADPAEDLQAILSDVLLHSGYDREDTVFCDFILDGAQPGTASAYRRIHEELFFLKGEFPYFYYSETDLSAGKE